MLPRSSPDDQTNSLTTLYLQGAKAQQKRERNAGKAQGPAKSQLKVNEAAKNIVCSVCRQTFVREHIAQHNIYRR